MNVTATASIRATTVALLWSGSALTQGIGALTPVVTVVDSAGIVGEFPAITTGADGRVVMSYRDETLLNLKVAYCWNASCSVHTITTLDAA